MDEQTVIGLLVKQIDEGRARCAEAITAGACADFAAYRELCGRIQGLDIARRNLQEMEVRLRRDEE